MLLIPPLIRAIFVLASQIVVTCKYPAAFTQPALIKSHTIDSIAMMPAKMRLAEPNRSLCPVTTRIIMKTTRSGMLVRTIALIKPAERVFSSSSGKTGGARNLRSEYCILLDSLIVLPIGKSANNLNGNFSII